jgi:hypothetical protein
MLREADPASRWSDFVLHLPGHDPKYELVQPKTKVYSCSIASIFRFSSEIRY